MLEAKLFYRRMESLLERLGADASSGRFAERLLESLVADRDLGLDLAGADLYRRRDGRLALAARFGAPGPDLARELETRVSGPPPAGIAELPWAGATGAGPTGLIGLPDEDGAVAALRFATGNGSEEARIAEILSMVSPLHFALPQAARRRVLEDLLEQARAIQVSLLPASPPPFGDFDIAALSIPASAVGGDFFDLLPLDGDTLVLAVADASGHGLPAALQARDVATGLRMGVEKDLKITRAVERLNRVIHRSGLASHFVSLVFGELEINGNFAYINAGHPPPLLLDDRGFHELAVGGMILGPHPEARYKLGFAHLDRGAALVLYSDGVIERGAERGDAFDVGRLAEWLEEWREGPADAAVADLMKRLRAAGGGGPFEDDVTVVFVRRPG
jgi:sigma-B regulation protein RsbU (phosphoserine phosphatase)